MGSTMSGANPSRPMTMTFRARRTSGSGDGGGGRAAAPYCLEENFDAISFTAPTTRRQNMRKKPAIAAKTEAIGIKESGPIYT